MCQEVLDLVCQMDTKNLQIQMALQCAPVIKGYKISNLFTFSKKEESAFRNFFKKSHLSYFYLAEHKGSVTYLLYRRKKLESFLGQNEVVEFLQTCDYDTSSLGAILRRFHNRYELYLKGQIKDFPHEMGAILGYPMEDVLGFIKHKGKGYLYSGYWKVYQDVEEKKKVFASYESAREELIYLCAKGYGIRAILEMHQDAEGIAV